MLKCDNCNKEFPGYVVIDGVKHSLYARRYCLECSPFNAHNTRSISNGSSGSPLRDRELLTRIMAESSSIKECLEKIGLRAAGSNYKTLIKYCEQYAIPIKRASGRLRSQKAISSNTIPLSEVLVENSAYSRSNLKKRLIAVGLIENKCAECGLQPIWNGKPISLHLEHKNGIYNDNRIDNLCLLCPNCHSQTSTYAGRNAQRSPSKTKNKASVKCAVCNSEFSIWPSNIRELNYCSRKCSATVRLPAKSTHGTIYAYRKCGPPACDDCKRAHDDYKQERREHSRRERQRRTGRAFGDPRPHAKMNEELVKALRKDAKDGMTMKELAKKYGISVGNAADIKNGKSWSKVTGE